ncbi:hypothetical protein [Streptococcus gallolyticus]|uniref:hypothetical protein n=1 Tax=Streptococcus gallolyticus TaxID=315405 RepID=UPI0008861823|nr:hypothetical protein [Streptococcus gallolyticus]SDJ59577.1 hypothetical protein SAMN04487842_0189 [Streptococcus gallolyticus]SDL08072.1 hypothetical protein SAMN04487841_0189 [Streptococcus gallolyticus]
MFRIQNLGTGQEQEFPNRAALLLGLEGEENRCLQLNQTATFQVFHLDKNQEVLESMELTIPSSGGEDVKMLLGDFGLKKEESKAFWKRGRQKPKQEGQSKDHSHPVKKVIGKEKEPKPSNLSKSQTASTLFRRGLKALVLVIALLLSCLSLWVSLSTKEEKIRSTVKTEQVTIDQKADVFCRFFIGNYFANSSAREDFVSKSLDLDQMTVEKATTLSVLLESQTTKQTTTTLTYVISCRYDDETTENKRLTLTVKQNKEAKYGYLVTKLPQLTAYP